MKRYLQTIVIILCLLTLVSCVGTKTNMKSDFNGVLEGNFLQIAFVLEEGSQMIDDRYTRITIGGGFSRYSADEILFIGKQITANNSGIIASLPKLTQNEMYNKYGVYQVFVSGEHMVSFSPEEYLMLLEQLYGVGERIHPNRNIKVADILNGNYTLGPLLYAKLTPAPDDDLDEIESEFRRFMKTSKGARRAK